MKLFLRENLIDSFREKLYLKALRFSAYDIVIIDIHVGLCGLSVLCVFHEGKNKFQIFYRHADERHLKDIQGLRTHLSLEQPF